MFRFGLFAGVLLLVALTGGAETEKVGPRLAGQGTPLQPIASGMKNPESVAIAPDGRIFVSVIGEFDKEGDGGIVVIQDGKAVPFATGLDDPKGLVVWRDMLYVTDRNRIWRINSKGKAEVHVAASAFPTKPVFLNDLEIDNQGVLYVADTGNHKGDHGAVFRVGTDRKVSVVVNKARDKRIGSPNGLRLVNEYHLHVADFASGKLFEVRLSDGKVNELAEGFGGADGITFDYHGRLYVSDWKGGKVHVIPRPGEKPVLLASGFQAAADICLTRDGKSILVPDMKAGTLTEVPCKVPGAEVNEQPLPVVLEPAFPDLQWTGWQGVTDSGRIIPHRPIVLTHAGDDRIFLATQHGVIHTFPNDQKATKTKIFLDMQSRVRYDDNQNEEGFLGLAFSPAFKKNGEFYVFYTLRNQKLTNVLSRFRVSKEDPDRADPNSEEVLLTIKRPFWNHDGGTIAFGPDGYLYLALGDGGLANDPFGHGQNLRSLLGKVLRLDVDRKENGLPYAIPADNPFMKNDKARPEIWAYGFRNIWRMSFDRKTGKLWAADVGQNLWEEINLVERGGNYGWNPREGLHPFGIQGVGPNKAMIDPIWEYHHDIGKSITGGHVYRGSRVPALEGLYLYADYVSGTIWALRYDDKVQRVTANHTLRQSGFPVFSFGEDNQGDVYLLTSTPTGKGLFRFAPRGK
ncbi:MAG: PQQ-dependent sugar dehydrogenase [Gemmataceae bacterium]